MSLIYVCTDYDLSGPSPRERARIGLLLSCLYSRQRDVELTLKDAETEEDNNRWGGEFGFIENEIKELCNLLPDKTYPEVIKELEVDYYGLLG